jgi:hypothetical protein
VTAHPGRFCGIATLPMQTPERAAAEPERAMTGLGLKGAQIGSNINGRNLDDPVLEPVWAAADRLGALIMMHPMKFSPSTLSTERAWTSVACLPSRHHMSMSSACVLEISIGEMVSGRSMRLWLSVATSRFMKARDVTTVTLAERAGAALLFCGEPAAAEPLRIADDGVEGGRLDRGEHARRFGEIGGERFFDQHRQAVLHGGENGIDMQMFVCGDDGASRFRPREQFAMIGEDEVAADGSGDGLAAIGIRLGDADPFYRRIVRRHFAAEQADAAGPTMASPIPFGCRPRILSSLSSPADGA